MNWKRHANTFKLFLLIGALPFCGHAQQPSVKDLGFLIGTWETEEHHPATQWWEKSTRTATYVLDSTYIQWESVAINSSHKTRTYRFLIHYDSKSNQFEMVCLYSNWPKVQTDILQWNKAARQLTLKSKPAVDVFSERSGTIQFSEDFREYVWSGINQSGDPQKPNIFVFEEKGNKK